MKTAIIPADGCWHELPDTPVRSIIAPTHNTATDIGQDGRGWVRVTAGDQPVEVEYAAGEPYTLNLSEVGHG
jgi:hypothetical protein